ncbi:MAG: DUF4831 family protein [Bacteroidota bacterium]|nr:DUF4831 family protein [Bacteroidota bacterium]
MNRLFSILIILFLGVTIAEAQNTVTPVEATSSSDGIYYSLPQAVLKVHVKVKRTDYYAGPLASYADEYLGKFDVSESDYSEYSVVEISMDDYAIPDPEQYYYVQFKAEGSKDSRALLMSLNSAGILSSINNQPVAINPEKGKTVAVNTQTDINKDDLFDFVAISPQRKIIDTSIRIITVDTSHVEEISYSARFEKKTLEEMAKEVAGKIEKILHDRYYISIGYQEVAYPAGTMKYMDGQLKKRQEAYTDLFLGKKVTGYEEYTFTVIPKKSEEIFSETICKFSKHSGVRSAASSLGKAINVVVTSLETTKKMAWHAESVMKAPKERKGIYYRIPEYANINVVFDNKEAFSDTRIIPQYGVVSFVPYANDMEFEIHPKTGALKKVGLKHID